MYIVDNLGEKETPYRVCNQLDDGRVKVLKNCSKVGPAESLRDFLEDNPVEIDYDNLPKPDKKFVSKRHASATPMAIAPKDTYYRSERSI